MNLLIKKAKIVDPLSSYNGKTVDILIESGRIQEIKKNISAKGMQVFELPNLHLSPGWVDLFADFCDPGYEYRETLETGSQAAAAGGYTDVCIVPNTKPSLDQKSSIEYLITKAANLPVTIHPIGAITKQTEGKDLAEMYDMKASGAIAFSDGSNTVQSSGVLLKALQYIKSFDGLIIQIPDDKTISPKGLMNEGIMSVQLGMQSRPTIAEEILVNRDINLAAYTDSNLHLTGVSTQGSLKLVQAAKQKKLKVTCSITPQHVVFSDEDLSTYDTHLKINPPLRTKREIKHLQNAVKNGIVDCIASHHQPKNIDEKLVEFEYAKFGVISLQTTYASINTAILGISQEKIVELLSINPRRILKLTQATIEKGNIASLTLFNPYTKWKVEQEKIFSKSKNSPYIGMELMGKPIGIFHKNKLSVFE